MPDLNEYDISLYDIQTYTEVTLNQATTLTVPTHVRGKSSGATGFLRYDVSNGTLLTLYNTKESLRMESLLSLMGLMTPEYQLQQHHMVLKK